MLIHQKKEFEILRDKMNGETGELERALSFPRLGVLNNGIFRILNVSMVSCFLFSLFVGIAVALAVDAFLCPRLVSIGCGVAVAVLLAVVSFLGAKRYAVAVENSDES